MSHRRPGSTRKDRATKPSHIINAHTPSRNWQFTAYLLDMREMALKNAKDPRFDPINFWKLIESLDTAKCVWNRLDRSAMEELPIEDRAVFLSRYIAACITAMARVPGILDVFTRSGMVRFDNVNVLIGRSKDPEADRHFYNLPALAPISSEVPGFSGAFLGMLQGRLERLLRSRNLIPTGVQDETDLKDRIIRAQAFIKVERLYGEARAASSEYLRGAYNGDEPGIIPVIASEGTPFLFMWLMSLNIIDELIDGLLRGEPYLKAIEGSEKNGISNFIATEDGINAGLHRIGNNEDK